MITLELEYGRLLRVGFKLYESWYATLMSMNWPSSALGKNLWLGPRVYPDTVTLPQHCPMVAATVFCLQGAPHVPSTCTLNGAE